MGDRRRLTARIDDRMGPKWNRPMSRGHVVMLVLVAFTLAAAIAIIAAHFQSRGNDKKQDEDYAALCQTAQRVAAVNAFRIEKDSRAFARTADLMTEVGNAASTPQQKARLIAIGDAFRDAGIAADVAAGVQRLFARSNCLQLPPLEELTVQELDRELNKELAARIAAQRAAEGRP